MPVTKPLIDTRVVNGSMLKGTNNYREPSSSSPPAESTGRSPPSDAPDERCVECGMDDPPAGVSKNSNVLWINCDSCHYWYHRCCVHVTWGVFFWQLVEPIGEILNKLQQLQQQTSTIRSWLLS